MKTLDRIQSILEIRGCRYEHDVHPSAETAFAVARADMVPARLFAKTVVVHTETGFGMAVLPADRRIDLDELRGILSAREIRLATEPELRELFPDCQAGTMPPLGNGILYKMPVSVDGLLTAQDTIAFNAGSHEDVVRMNTGDWLELVRPAVVSFAHSAAAKAG